MQNSRMVPMKSNLQMYNYRVSHIMGKKNHIADVLSRRPVWLNLDSTNDPDEVRKPHLIRDILFSKI